MNSRSQFSEEAINKIGLRLRSCRVLTGLNQEQFAEKFNFPYTTIRNWEFGKVVPRKTGVSEFITALKSMNIFVDGEWILFGHGPGPSFDLSVDTKEIDYLKKENKFNKSNLLNTIVYDNLMAPWFCKGDTLSGTLITADKLRDLLKSELAGGLYPVLVRLENGVYAPRWAKMLDEKLLFTSCSSNIEQISPVSVALILSHEIKYPRSACNN